MRWAILLAVGCGFQPRAANDGGVADTPSDVVLDAGPDAFQAIAYVQGTVQITSSDTAITVVVPNDVHAGDLVVVAVQWDDVSGSVVSITDTAGAVYRAVGPATQAPPYVQKMYYAPNSPGGATSITVTLDRVTQIELRVLEYSGIATISPLDGFASDHAQNGTMLDSGAVMTAHAHDLLVDANVVNSTTPAVDGPDFTPRVTINGDSCADREVTTAGMYRGLATHVNTTWLMQMAAFAAAD